MSHQIKQLAPASCSLRLQLGELQLLLLLLLTTLLSLWAQISSATLAPCPNPVKNVSLAYENKDNKTDPELVSAVDDVLKTDVHKACLGVVKARAALTNHFLIADVNDTLVIDPGVCSQTAEKLTGLVNESEWVVALRSSHKHMPLFEYPIRVPNRDKVEFKRAKFHKSLIWEKVDTLAFAKDYCLTETGQLQVLRFDPLMSGTYRFLLPKISSSVTDPSTDEMMDSQLERTMFHLDYIYDDEEKFEGVDIRQLPMMAPKVTKVRMYDLRNKNLRYQFRTMDSVLKSTPMDPISSTGQKLYPKKTFDDLGIKMSWMPPPELQQFTHWKPACGTRINRDRYLRCTATVDVADIKTRLTNIIGKTVHSKDTKLKYDEATKTKYVLYDDGHGVSVLYHLYLLAIRMETQLKDEAVISPNQRPLYTAGFRWKENSAEGTLTLPCHYTYLHHLPWVSVKDPLSRGIRIYIPNIPNMGEREQAVMLCGISDPMELLRMLGRVLVAQLRNLVVLSTRRRPVVPQRSVVYSGKTVYMKCPVDMHLFESPACSLPKKEDNILWTLNGKTIRFFGEGVDRGASLSPTCGLTIKKIGYNDAGEYVCYRTPLGAKMVENTPAYRHFIEVTRPDFDPPPIEEVYFGLAVCFTWHGFLILLWTLIALLRSCLSLLARRKGDNEVKPEVWTSFFDNDPELEGGDSDSDDDEDEEDDNEGEENGQEAEDEASPMQSIMFSVPGIQKSRDLRERERGRKRERERDRQSKQDDKNPPPPPPPLKGAKAAKAAAKAQPDARRRRRGPGRGRQAARRKKNAPGTSPAGKRNKKED